MENIHPLYQVAYSGTSVLVSCNSKLKLTEDKPKWYKNGVSIPEFTLHRSILLSNLSLLDSANYTCEGSHHVDDFPFNATSSLIVAGIQQTTMTQAGDQ